MQIILHQTHHKLADLESIFGDLMQDIHRENENQRNQEDQGKRLHLYPENYLTGYPLQDLVVTQEFIQRYQASLQTLEDQVLKIAPCKNCVFLVGGLKYELGQAGFPQAIENVIYAITPGQKIKSIYTKRLLPNYDIFDEKKYYRAGKDIGIFDFAGKKLALLICEDMWPGHTHDIDPVQQLSDYAKTEKTSFDLVVNLSASPFFKGKWHSRLMRAKQIADELSAPFVYLNRVGGEDEILFDGGSFLLASDGKIIKSPRFCSHTLETNLDELTSTETHIDNAGVVNTWEDLYQNQLDEKNIQTLPTLSDNECQEVLAALCFGLQEYMNKCGFDKISLALSGGIDSGVVLAIAALALQDPSRLEAIYMPSQFSQDLSRELCEELCSRLGIRLRHFPIKFLHSAAKTQFVQHLGSEITGLADENIQSRIRGLLIYARSNQTGSLILNTSNKSELAVGYSTLYGDSVGALSILGDLYKSQVYKLALYINKKYGDVIPQQLIAREPTAELREGQADSQSLPPYERLDAILEGILSYQKSSLDLVNAGFDQEEITKVVSLYEKSEYKRRQFCPILKVEAKSFGFGYRMPITKRLSTFK